MFLALRHGTLFDRVRFARSSRLVNLEIPRTRQQNTVHRQHIPRFQRHDIPDNGLVDRDFLDLAVSEDHDDAVVFDGVEFAELLFFLVVVDGTGENDDDDGDENGAALC